MVGREVRRKGGSRKPRGVQEEVNPEVGVDPELQCLISHP